MSNPNLERFKAAAAMAGKASAVRPTKRPVTTHKVTAELQPATNTVSGSVFLIDPQERVGKMLASQLKAQHIETNFSTNAMEALMFLEMEKVDLIIIAVDPTDMPALTCCSRIRGGQKSKNTPILIAQETVDDKSTKAATTEGANGLIHRPYRLQELMAAIRTTLEKNQPPAPPSA